MILLGLAGLIFLFTEESYALIETLSTSIRSYFGRFYLILGLVCVLLLAGLAVSPMGKFKLGRTNEKPGKPVNSDSGYDFTRSCRSDLFIY